jgi:HAD superfamily hydrolase (TIGR01459 family)
MSSPAPQLISGLEAIAKRYDAVLCDVWGVVHNGEIGFTEAHAALTRFQQTRGPVVLISNAPRPASAILPQLRALQTPESAYAAIVTSGDVTRAELEARAPGPAWAIGPDRDQPVYDGIPITFSGPEDAAFVCATGLVDDERETAEDYRGRLAVAARRGIELICANPDRVVQRGPLLIPCAGALADVYEDLGGPVIMAGKLYPRIYQRAMAEIERITGRSVPSERVLAIGDGLPTDVVGANRMGLDCLFVTSGIHAADTQGADGQPDPARLTAFLASNGASARYAMAELAWAS